MTDSGSDGKQDMGSALKAFNDFFETKGLAHDYDPEKQTVVCRFSAGTYSAVMYILTTEQLAVLSCKPMIEVPESKTADVLELLNSINCRMSIGRFVLEDRGIKYRIYHDYRTFPLDDEYAAALISIMVTVINRYSSEILKAVGEDRDPDM